MTALATIAGVVGTVASVHSLTFTIVANLKSNLYWRANLMDSANDVWCGGVDHASWMPWCHCPQGWKPFSCSWIFLKSSGQMPEQTPDHCRRCTLAHRHLNWTESRASFYNWPCLWLLPCWWKASRRLHQRNRWNSRASRSVFEQYDSCLFTYAHIWYIASQITWCLFWGKNTKQHVTTNDLALFLPTMPRWTVVHQHHECQQLPSPVAF